MLPHSESGLPAYILDGLNRPEDPTASAGVRETLAQALADVPGQHLLWAGLVAVLVGIGLVVLAVWFLTRQARRAVRLVRARIARLQQWRREQATADSEQLTIAGRIEQLRSQNWRGWIAKAHLGLGMLLSGWGIAEVAKVHGEMPFPSNLLAFLAFEGLAVAVMMRIEDRANRGVPYPGLMVVYWTAIAAATALQTTHVDNLVGKAIWAGFTLSAGVNYHSYVLSLRSDQEKRLLEAQGLWVQRRLALSRWVRPIESLQVVLERATDESMSAQEATRRVRERVAQRRQDRALNRVMWAVWRLRRAQQARRVWGLRTFLDWVESNHLVLTQREIARARLSASPEALVDLLQRLEAMDLAPKLARMSSPTDARLIAGSFGATFSQGVPGGVGASMSGVGEQFALPPGRVRSQSEPEPGPVRVFVVEQPAEPVRSASGAGPVQSGLEGEVETGPVRAEPSQPDPVRSEVETDPVRSEPVEEAGVWRYAEDGWTPPTAEEAWNAPWPELDEGLFGYEETPQKRILPLHTEPAEPVRPAARVDPVRSGPRTGAVQLHRTLEQLQEELRQALVDGRLTHISAEAIVRVLGVGKPRARKLRDWALEEGLSAVSQEEQAQ